MITFFWIGFILFIMILLALDLGLFHKKDHEPTAREGLQWTLVWVVVGLLFSLFVYGAYSAHWFGIGLNAEGEPIRKGDAAALDYLTGYLIEYSLSMDNIFVMSLIFSYFKIPGKYQHRVLFWGILGAIIMRASMILAGAALVNAFEWVLYVFGVFLIFTALKMLRHDDNDFDPEHGLLVRIVRRLYPVSPDLEGNQFFTRLPDGRRAVTRLFIALVVIENTDVIFAIDSIPAIFAVTTDPFLVFSSNIFAILGLRSLYFALNAILNLFHLLKLSIVFILLFVGVKMLIVKWVHIPSGISLAVIASSLTLGVIASRCFPKKEAQPLEPTNERSEPSES